MNKIPTLFKRDWEGNRGVVNELSVDYDFAYAMPTEKLDGTNVRLTVRSHTLVRLEKRRNPSKLEKAQGIAEPWYIDADEFDPGDKFIWEAARNTDLSGVDDGEWSGEAIGPKIQGNSLNLEKHIVVLFSIPAVREKLNLGPNVPTSFEKLKEWLPTAKSVYGTDCGIEGVVWHGQDGSMCKIKTKDFK